MTTVDCQTEPAADERPARAPRAGADNGDTAATEPFGTFPRSRLHEAATRWAQRAAVGLDFLSGRRPGKGFGILTYHRVADEIPGVEPPSVSVTPQRLREHLSGLLARGFEAWPLRRAIDAFQANQPVPHNVFVVTFDDGYENNLQLALPILEELRVPATIFLATAYLDTDRPFPFENWSFAGSSRVPAISWRPLTTSQCHALLESDLIELGVHTHTHQSFVGRAEEFRRDLEISIRIAEERFDITHPTFSFPFGLTTPEMMAAAKQAGVTCALTTQPALVQHGSSPFGWGRFNACDSDTATSLMAKLHGWYTPVADVLRNLKRPLAALAPKVTGEFAAAPQSNSARRTEQPAGNA